MDRRQYLGAAAAGVAVGVAGAVGNTVLNSNDKPEGPPHESTAPYPPYPETEPIELSGEGSTASQSFELANDGPTIIRADHEGDSPFVVKLQSMETSTVRDVVRIGGPYTGSTVVQPVPAGRYELFVSRTSASWTATVHDLPVYDDSELTPPIAYRGGLNTVIGPIKFADLQIVKFALDIDNDVTTTLSLIDRAGETAATLIRQTAAQLEQTDTATFTQNYPVGGVGYIAIDTNTSWTLRVTEKAGSGQSSGNATNESGLNTTEPNSTTETTESTTTNSTNDSG